MMNNYKTNLRLFHLSEAYQECEDIMGKNPERDAVAWGDGANWHEFDPCNVWNDLMPIVIKLGSHSVTLLGDLYEAELRRGSKVTKGYGDTPQLALANCCISVLNEKDKQ